MTIQNLHDLATELRSPDSEIYQYFSKMANEQLVAILNRQGIYHLQPFEISIHIDEYAESENMPVHAAIRSIPHDVTWETNQDLIDYQSNWNRDQWIADIEYSIMDLIKNKAEEFDSAMPDRSWTLGIDLPTKRWLEANAEVEMIRNILRTASPTSSTIMAHKNETMVTSQGVKVACGARVTLSALVLTATIDLGNEATYHQGVVRVKGAIPDLIRDAMVGQDASKIIDHALLKDAGTIRQVLDNQDEDPEEIETCFVLERSICPIDDFIAELDQQSPLKLSEI